MASPPAAAAAACALFLSTVAVFVAAGAAAGATPASWPQAGGNPQRTQHFKGALLGDAPAELWRFAPGGSFSVGVAIGAKDAEGRFTVYAPNPALQVVYAIKTPTVSSDNNAGAGNLLRALFGVPSATKLWEVTAAASSPPTLTPDGTLLLFGASNGTLCAVHADTGVPAWTFNSGDSPITSSPTVADGVAYVASGDGTFFAVNAATGAPEWSCVSRGGIPGGASVSADGSEVYFASLDTFLYAVSTSNNTCDKGAAKGSPCRDIPAHGGQPAVKGCASWWAQPNHQALMGPSPAVDTGGHRLLVTTEGTPSGPGGVFSVDTTSHAVSTLYSAKSGAQTGAAVVASNAHTGASFIAFVDDANTVYGVNVSSVSSTQEATTAAWQHSAGAAVSSTPITNGELVVVPTRAGSVLALHSATGAVAWEASADGAIGGPIAVDSDGRVVVGTASGKLSGFGHGSTGLSPLWSAVFSGAVVLGLFEGIAGYRFFSFTVALVGFGGFGPPAYIAGTFLKTVADNAYIHWGVAAGAGLLGTILLLTLLRRVAVFLLGLGAGVLLGVNLGVALPFVPHLSASPDVPLEHQVIPLAVVAGAGILMGALSCCAPKLISVLATSLVGATITVDGAAYFTSISNPTILGAGYAGVTIVFALVQLCCTGTGEHHLSAAEIRERKAEQDRDNPFVDPYAYGSMDNGSDEEARGSRKYTTPGRRRNWTPSSRGSASSRRRGGDDDATTPFTTDFEPLVSPGSRGSPGSSRLYSNVDRPVEAPPTRPSHPPASADLEFGGMGKKYRVVFQKGPLGLRLGRGTDRTPVYVLGVTPRGQADTLTVHEGDFLVAIADRPIGQYEPYEDVLDELKRARRPVALTFRAATGATSSSDGSLPPGGFRSAGAGNVEFAGTGKGDSTYAGRW